MISKHKPISDDLLRQYIRIEALLHINNIQFSTDPAHEEKVLRIKALFEENKPKFVTNMTVEEEEALRENFLTTLLTLSSAEIVELAQRTRDITYEELQNHPETGLLILYLFQSILGGRYPSKFLQKYPMIVISDPREVIEYSKEEEETLKQLILSLKADVSESKYFKIDALIEHVTGEQTHLMEDIWKKYDVNEK